MAYDEVTAEVVDRRATVEYVSPMRVLGVALCMTLGIGATACGSSSTVPQTVGATAAVTASSPTSSASSAGSEPSTPATTKKTGTLELVLEPNPGQPTSQTDLAQAATAIRTLAAALKIDATVDVVGESVHVTVANMSDSDRSDITDSLNLTGTVYLRPVLVCAPPTPTTTPDTVVDTTNATGSVGADPSPHEILPTRDGGRCQVGPAAGTGDVFVANSAVASTMNNGGWGVTVDLKSGASGEGVWNAIASECFNKAPTCPSQQLAIELNGVIQTAPTIFTTKFSGPVQLTGNFTERQARAIANTLNSGALPFTLREVSAVFTP